VFVQLSRDATRYLKRCLCGIRALFFLAASFQARETSPLAVRVSEFLGCCERCRGANGVGYRWCLYVVVSREVALLSPPANAREYQSENESSLLRCRFVRLVAIHALTRPHVAVIKVCLTNVAPTTWRSVSRERISIVPASIYRRRREESSSRRCRERQCDGLALRENTNARKRDTRIELSSLSSSTGRRLREKRSSARFNSADGCADSDHPPTSMLATLLPSPPDHNGTRAS